jgi:hypothetical protein
VRDRDHGIALGKPFARWLGPKLSVNGAATDYAPVYWGDAAARFRWDLTTRPKTAILHAGGTDGFAGLGSLRDAGRQSPLDRPAARPADGPVLGANAGGAAPPPTPPLSSIPPADRPDFLADLYLAVWPRKTGRGDARDPIADDPSVARWPTRRPRSPPTGPR